MGRDIEQCQMKLCQWKYETNVKNEDRHYCLERKEAVFTDDITMDDRQQKAVRSQQEEECHRTRTGVWDVLQLICMYFSTSFYRLYINRNIQFSTIFYRLYIEAQIHTLLPASTMLYIIRNTHFWTSFYRLYIHVQIHTLVPASTSRGYI